MPALSFGSSAPSMMKLLLVAQMFHGASMKTLAFLAARFNSASCAR
jgi:hypothetical protein